jgi:Bardet-Biedl syndrome 1 protein
MPDAAPKEGSGSEQQRQQAKLRRGVWLEAWSDPLGGLNAYTPCVHTCNLRGDGQWQLVVADMAEKKLKVPLHACTPRGRHATPRQMPLSCNGLLAFHLNIPQVWRGSQRLSEHALLDTPVALASFIPDASYPRLASLAVASGPHVYIFRNLRPYYKFTLPPKEVNAHEQEVW